MTRVRKVSIFGIPTLLMPRRYHLVQRPVTPEPQPRSDNESELNVADNTSGIALSTTVDSDVPQARAGDTSTGEEREAEDEGKAEDSTPVSILTVITSPASSPSRGAVGLSTIVPSHWSPSESKPQKETDTDVTQFFEAGPVSHDILSPAYPIPSGVSFRTPTTDGVVSFGHSEDLSDPLSDLKPVAERWAQITEETENTSDVSGGLGSDGGINDEGNDANAPGDNEEGGRNSEHEAAADATLAGGGLRNEKRKRYENEGSKPHCERQLPVKRGRL